MQNTKKSNQNEALEALLSEIEPTQATEVLETSFLRYIVSEDFATLPDGERETNVFVLTSVINLFRNMKGINSWS
jgi:hypothetical protein